MRVKKRPPPSSSASSAAGPTRPKPGGGWNERNTPIYGPLFVPGVSDAPLLRPTFFLHRIYLPVRSKYRNRHKTYVLAKVEFLVENIKMDVSSYQIS